MSTSNETIGPYIAPQPEFPEGHPVLGVAAGTAVGTIMSPAIGGPIGAAVGFLIAKSSWESTVAACADESNLLNLTQRYIMKPSKNYVPDGVFLICSSGRNPAKLKVGSQSSVKMASGKLMSTMNDRMDCNMNCTMMVIAGAIIGAVIAAIAVAIVAAAGILSGGTAWVAIGVGAAAGLAGAGVGAGLGQLTSMIPCICDFLTRGAPWVPVHTFTKAEKQMVLIETSQLPCFFGGVIQIVYSEPMAAKLTDINSNEMWRDLGTVALGSIILGATGAGLGGLVYGGSVAFSAGGWSGLGAYGVGAGSNMAANILSGLGVDFVKGQIYSIVPAGDNYSLEDRRNGKVVSDALYSDKENAADNFKKIQEDISGYTDSDGGSVGGIYRGKLDGVWGDNNFVSAATNPNLANYGKLVRGQFVDGLNPFSGTGKAFFALDIFTDFYKMWRNSALAEDLKELGDIYENEEIKAKKSIKVIENDI